MDPFSAGAVRAAYDAVATDYAHEFGDDLDRLPLDRWMLDAAFTAAGPGWVVDVGCGPAPAATYLADRADKTLGIDLSEAMLRVAGRRNPGLRRAQGDVRRLPLRARSCALVIASYALQHVARAEMGLALSELRRVLTDGGVLLLATHLGEGDIEMHELLGHHVAPFGGVFYARDELLSLLSGAGFTVEVERQRDALPHEHDSRRIYLLARCAT